MFVYSVCVYSVSTPCGGGKEYFNRNPCESQEATERETSSLRRDIASRPKKKINENLSLDKPLHVIQNHSKLADTI
jgi:hypothetical protein